MGPGVEWLLNRFVGLLSLRSHETRRLIKTTCRGCYLKWLSVRRLLAPGMLFSAILARARARPNNSQSESHHNKRFIRERARASKVDFQLAGSLGCETRSHCSCTHADREKSDSSLEEATKRFSSRSIATCFSLRNHRSAERRVRRKKNLPLCHHWMNLLCGSVNFCIMNPKPY